MTATPFKVRGTGTSRVRGSARPRLRDVGNAGNTGAIVGAGVISAVGLGAGAHGKVIGGGAISTPVGKVTVLGSGGVSPLGGPELRARGVAPHRFRGSHSPAKLRGGIPDSPRDTTFFAIGVGTTPRVATVNGGGTLVATGLAHKIAHATINGGGVIYSSGVTIITSPTVPEILVTGLNTQLNRYSQALQDGIQPITSTGGSTNRGNPSPQPIKLV